MKSHESVVKSVLDTIPGTQQLFLCCAGYGLRHGKPQPGTSMICNTHVARRVRIWGIAKRGLVRASLRKLQWGWVRASAGHVPGPLMSAGQ